VIQGLDEEADMIRVLRVDEARRLMTKHTFDKLAMVEHILDIELVDWSMAQRRADGCRHYDERRTSSGSRRWRV
jgi:hypothetical protein